MVYYDEDALVKFRLAGRVLRETREEMRSFVREGLRVLEVCERAEALIKSKGALPAFPCNVSINEVAAHYTSPPGDQTRIPSGAVVKVDFGAHVDGYVADTAFTVCFNPELNGLVEASEEALDVAVRNVRAGVSTGRLGEVIEKCIRGRGFRPVSNLTGHSVGRFLVHAGTSIPNVAQLSLAKLQAGGVYAIEPFVTLHDASGRVEDAPETTIYRFVKSRPTFDVYARQLMKYIEETFHTLPFAERWLQNVVPAPYYSQAFRELLSSRVISGYAVFVEQSGKPVAQSEHTVLVTEAGCEVLT